MIFDSSDLQAIRECCRDDAAFEQLQAILVKKLATLEKLTEPDQRRVRYEAILNALPDRVFLSNRNGDNLDFKGTPEDEKRGFSPETIRGTNLRQFVPPDLAQRCLDAIAQALDTGNLQTLEYQLSEDWKANGDLRDYEVRVVASGEEEVLAIERDVTDLKQAEKRQLQAENQYRSIFEAISDGLIIGDPDTGIVVEANPAVCEMHGYPREEFIGLAPHQFIHPDSFHLFEEYVAAIKANRPFRCRAVDIKKDGTPFLVEVIGTRFNYRGKPHLLAVVRDITEQVEAEKALRLSEARNRALVNAIPDFVFRLDANGTFLDMETALDEDLIQPAEGCIGKTVDMVLPETAAQRWLYHIRQALATRELQSFEYQVPIKGVWRDREARVVVCGEQEVVVFMRDITERKQAERASDRERRLFAEGPVIVFRWVNEDNWPVEYVSANVSQFGYSPEDFTSRKLLYGQIVHPEDLDRVGKEVEQGVASRLNAVEQDYRIIRADGEVRWVYDLCGIVRDEQGEVTHYEGYVLDITDRKQVEAALRENEARFRLLVEQSLVGIYVIKQGKVAYVNPRLAQMMGYTVDELIGHPVLDIVIPEDREMAAENIRRRMQGEVDALNYTLRVLRKDGVQLEVEVLGSRTNFNGEPAIMGTLLDVTERKQSEKALRESEEKFSKAFSSSPAAMSLTTLSEARILDINDSFLKATGYTRDEVIGKTIPELNIWVNLAHRDEMRRTLLEFGEVHNLETPFRRKSGEIGVMLFSADIITFKGEPCVLGVTVDITDRKRAQEALELSEARNQAFLNAIPDLMFRIHRDGTYLDCKADQDSDFAVPPAEMIGKTVYQVLPPEVAQERMYYIEQTLKTGKTQVFEYQLMHHGELRDYEARLVVSGQDEVLAIMRDITERKRTEAQLRANAERDRLLGQIALRIRRSLNLDQILTTTVEEVRQFLEADRVFIGQIDLSWQGRIMAESFAPEWGSILSWITNDLHLREIRALFAQGYVQAIDDTAEAAVSPLLADYYAQCQIRASLGVPILLEDQFFAVLVAQQCSHPRHWTPFEIELMSQLATQVAIAIQQAELYQQVQNLNTDLEQLNASLEQQVQERTAQLQQSMIELQELSQVKDDFLHTVSHDLRTPVMGMLMVLKNLQNKATDSVPLSRSVLDRMVQSCDRQVNMINSLLEAHSAEMQGISLNYECVNLGELVRAIVDDLDALVVDNQATLTNQIANDLPTIQADPTQLRRVFENLITNALKHNPPGLQVTLSATLEEDAIRCCVQDNGVGMTTEECETLFERYAQGSRSRRSAGIGLGLYVCRQIITAHGGIIGAISKPGEGATFWFTLPLVGG